MLDLHNNIPERTNVQDGIPANRNNDPTESLEVAHNPECFGYSGNNVPSCTCHTIFDKLVTK